LKFLTKYDTLSEELGKEVDERKIGKSLFYKGENGFLAYL